MCGSLAGEQTFSKQGLGTLKGPAFPELLSIHNQHISDQIRTGGYENRLRTHSQVGKVTQFGLTSKEADRILPK